MDGIFWVDKHIIHPNKDNPRTISEAQMEKLKKSIQEFPEMLKLRPIIVDKDNVIIGGNMRYEALKQLGYGDIPIVKADELTPEQIKEFIIKDNLGYGEWDFDVLKVQWDLDQLGEWGLEVTLNDVGGDAEKYTKKIEAPTYEPKNEQPDISTLVNADKMRELAQRIQNSNLPQHEKSFLLIACNRHLVFDYAKIADYYSHASKEMQDLMEKSALVIIDYNRAIEEGYVKLSQTLADLYSEDHNEE